MSRSRGPSQVPIEEKVRVVLAVLGGEMTLTEAARRHGTTSTVGKWRDRFLEAGKAGAGECDARTQTARRRYQ